MIWNEPPGNYVPAVNLQGCTRFDRFNQRINQIRNAKISSHANHWIQDLRNTQSMVGRCWKCTIFRENHSKSPSIWSPQYIFRHITRAHTKFPPPPPHWGLQLIILPSKGDLWWKKAARGSRAKGIDPRMPRFFLLPKKVSLVCLCVSVFWGQQLVLGQDGVPFCFIIFFVGMTFFPLFGPHHRISKLINSNQVTSFRIIRIHGEYEGLLVSTWRQEKSGNSTVATFKARRTIFGINPSPPPVMSIVVV